MLEKLAPFLGKLSGGMAGILSGGLSNLGQVGHTFLDQYAGGSPISSILSGGLGGYNPGNMQEKISNALQVQSKNPLQNPNQGLNSHIPIELLNGIDKLRNKGVF